MVFQLQFAFLETAQLQLVVVAIEHQHVYDRVEVSMFNVEFDQAALDVLDVIHGGCSEQFYNVDGVGARPEALWILQ